MAAAGRTMAAPSMAPPSASPVSAAEVSMSVTGDSNITDGNQRQPARRSSIQRVASTTAAESDHDFRLDPTNEYDDDDGGDDAAQRRGLQRLHPSRHSAPTSDCETSMNFIKANIGTGILAIPNAFRFTGLLLGFGLVVLLGVILGHCMHIMIRLNAWLSHNWNVDVSEYGSVVRHTFRHTLWHRHARFLGRFVRIIIIINQLGVGSVYIDFLGHTIAEIVHWAAPLAVALSPRTVIFMISPLLFIYLFVKDLKGMAKLSAAANGIVIVALSILISYQAQDLPPLKRRPLIRPTLETPLFLGTVMFCFESINQVIPMYKHMDQPSHFDRRYGVLNVGIFVVTCMYALIGVVGYWRYGEQTKDLIILNLPDRVFFQFTKLMFCANVFVSYGLQMFLPFVMLRASLRSLIQHRVPLFAGNIAGLEKLHRAVLILFTVAVAVSIPKIAIFISIVGSLIGSFLCVILPASLEAAVCITTWGNSRPMDSVSTTTSLAGDLSTTSSVVAAAPPIITAVDYDAANRRTPTMLAADTLPLINANNNVNSVNNNNINNATESAAAAVVPGSRNYYSSTLNNSSGNAAATDGISVGSVQSTAELIIGANGRSVDGFASSSLVYMDYFSSDQERRTCLWRNFLLVSFGLVAMVTGCYASISDLMKDLRQI